MVIFQVLGWRNSSVYKYWICEQSLQNFINSQEYHCEPRILVNHKLLEYWKFLSVHELFNVHLDNYGPCISICYSAEDKKTVLESWGCISFLCKITSCGNMVILKHSGSMFFSAASSMCSKFEIDASLFCIIWMFRLCCLSPKFITCPSWPFVPQITHACSLGNKKEMWDHGNQ